MMNRREAREFCGEELRKDRLDSGENDVIECWWRVKATYHSVVILAYWGFKIEESDKCTEEVN